MRNPLLVVKVVGEGESPKTVVEHAVDLNRSAGGEGFDETWCVFDRDEHPQIQDAMQQARAHGFSVAFSNPSFELWVLLHFRDQRAHLSRQEAARLVRQEIPGYEKNIPFETILPHYPVAVGRATRLTAWQVDQGRVCENPWTDVHLLTERIVYLSKQAKEHLRPRA